MKYLKNSDYLSKSTQHDFETLLHKDVASAPLFIFDAELKAQALIEMYLRGRYDLSAVFKTFPNYQTGLTYNTGSTVWFTVDGSPWKDYLYSPTGTTSADPTADIWQMIEPRYVSVVDWMTTIALYNLHQRVSPENIPVHRQYAYEEVLMWLKMIQEGKLSTDFPEVENSVQTLSISGEEAQTDFYY